MTKAKQLEVGKDYALIANPELDPSRTVIYNGGTSWTIDGIRLPYSLSTFTEYVLRVINKS